jgi:hypothetical protein
MMNLPCLQSEWTIYERKLQNILLIAYSAILPSLGAPEEDPSDR